MRKILTLSALSICFTSIIEAQEPSTLKEVEKFKPSGTATGTVFFDYKYDLTKDVKQASAFEIDRAYLGYKYDFAKNISGKVLYDVGYDAGTRSYSAFLKYAMIDWAIMPKLKLSAGVIGLRQFDTQEKFWGYRYIMKSYVDQYGLGTSADLGFNIELTLHEKITINAFVLNGEGYKSLQDMYGMHRFGGNIVAKPLKGLVAKVHYDIMPNKYQQADNLPIIDTSTISNLSLFVGYELKDKFRIGIEYNELNNAKNYKNFADGYKLGGISVYGTYIINNQFEVLARFDKLGSNKIGNAAEVWNISKDGSLILAGVHYKPVKNVNVGLNYRNFSYDDKTIDSFSALFINLGLAF